VSPGLISNIINYKGFQKKLFVSLLRFLNYPRKHLTGITAWWLNQLTMGKVTPQLKGEALLQHS